MIMENKTTELQNKKKYGSDFLRHQATGRRWERLSLGMSGKSKTKKEICRPQVD